MTMSGMSRNPAFDNLEHRGTAMFGSYEWAVRNREGLFKILTSELAYLDPQLLNYHSHEAYGCASFSGAPRAPRVHGVSVFSMCKTSGPALLDFYTPFCKFAPVCEGLDLGLRATQGIRLEKDFRGTAENGKCC